jgi:purine nucleosidase
VEVYAGCDRPLVRPLATASHIHGETGLGGARLPRSGAEAGAAHAVDFITESLRVRRDGITLAPTGPLTNLARVLSKDPAVAANISEIVLMGGAAGAGNVTPHAEFNVFVDPHAAAAVFASGVPLIMIGLDVTRQAVVTPARLAAIGAVGTPAAAAAAAMLSGYLAAPLHDPCVIAWLLRPDLFAGRPARVTVETEDEETIGRTNVDWEADGANATVIETVDAPALFTLLIAALARL